MKNKYKNIKVALLIITLYLLTSIIQIIPFIILNINVDKLSNTFKIIYTISYEILFIFIIFKIYQKELTNSFKLFFKNIGEYFFKYIPYWFLLIFLMYISNFIIYYFTNGIAKNEEQIRKIADHYPIYILILTILIAPVLEELIFRKCIRKIFQKRNIYIFVSGLFFGLMHIIGNTSTPSDILYIIPYSIPGFIFAYIYTESDNIFSTIGLHMMHNTILIVIQLLT